MSETYTKAIALAVHICHIYAVRNQNLSLDSNHLVAMQKGLRLEEFGTENIVDDTAYNLGFTLSGVIGAPLSNELRSAYIRTRQNRDLQLSIPGHIGMVIEKQLVEERLLDKGTYQDGWGITDDYYKTIPLPKDRWGE